MLGIDLKTAEALLKAEGKQVHLVEVRSKKGGKGDDARVIKSTETDTETIVYWSAFKTEVTTPPSRLHLDTSPYTGEARREIDDISHYAGNDEAGAISCLPCAREGGSRRLTKGLL